MTPVEEEITRRLHAAAERITVVPETVVELHLEPEDGHDPVPPVTLLAPAPPQRRRRLAPLAVAAACVAALVLVGAVVVTEDGDPAATAAPASDLTLTEPVAPWSDDPPAWVGELGTAWADRHRDGTWVTGAIAKVGDDGSIDSPIRISVFDGWERALDEATETEIDGRPVLEYVERAWRVLATPEPADGPAGRVMVSGPADAPLAEVLREVEIVAGGAAPATYHLGALPDGYEEVVAPLLQADLGRKRPAIHGADGHVVVYDLSEWVDPTLVSFSGGSEPAQVEIDGISGWTYEFEPTDWPAELRVLVWSPEPGVVFEVVSDDPDHTVEMLAELAATVTVQPLDEWQQLHDA